jgi:hypothetical protein
MALARWVEAVERRRHHPRRISICGWMALA